MSRILDTVISGNLEELKHIITQNPEYVHIEISPKWSLLDIAINYGKLEMANFLYEKGGRPNLDKLYRDGNFTPVHRAAQSGYTKTLKWIFTEKVLPLHVLNIKDHNGWIPLDRAIACGILEMANFLFEKGGRPNLEIYCDRHDTPVTRATQSGYTKTLKWIFTEKVLPRSVLNIQHINGCTPLDHAIACGELETAKCLWEMGGRPNPKIYCDGNLTPMHRAALRGYITTLEWVFTEENVLSLDVLKIKNRWKRTPLDVAIAFGKLEIAKFLFEKGGRPNLYIYYCDGDHTPVHHAANYGYAATLKWAFTEKILPLSVLNIQDEWEKTPLDCAITNEKWKTAALLQRLMYFDPVFLAMQRAKRDHHRTLLRRLPNELLDMVVDEVAARFHLKVVW